MKLNKQNFALLLGLIGLIAPLLLPLEGLNFAGQITLGIFLMAAIFWLLEPIPIFATSVLVILLQVFFLSGQGLLGDYLGQIEGYSPQSFRDFYGTLASPIIILFLGGFSLAAASVKYGLDRNLTRWLLRPFGSRSQYVCLGLMVATATLSAFMSNTATTAMMITVVIPIIAQLEKGDPFRKVVALCIPFAANIGGIATPIGTPPNAIALAALREQGINVTFSTWMMVAVPLVAIMLLVAWRLLLWIFPPATTRFEVKFEGTLDKSPAAIGTYCVFALTVALWVTEALHGISSTVVAFIPIALLPALSILDKSDIRGFSWEVLWLVAGGISLGLSLEQTGLAAWLVDLVNWGALNGLLLFVVFGAVGFGLALFISNTVSATILVPLAVGLGLSGAAGLEFNMTILILVIAITVSFPMVLPISTPPNAIAMSTGMIETKDMVRGGLIIGVFGFAATLVFSLFYFPIFF
ncbi:MAG: DASS family sodium-coupled anion symporter [Puniceicoccaceae bacterium]|nr:MAG: DASS family sodium-coupled anion symporter [Puniceicoccaceae bacterium]